MVECISFAAALSSNKSRIVFGGVAIGGVWLLGWVGEWVARGGTRDVAKAKEGAKEIGKGKEMGKSER